MQDFLTAAIEFVALSTLLLIVAAEACKARPQVPRVAQPQPPEKPAVQPIVARAFPGIAQGMNRRQLLRMAKERRIPNYSRINTHQLREALILACS